MVERLKSPLAQKYRSETDELIAFGSEVVSNTNFSAENVGPHLFISEPSYVNNPGGQTMVNLSEPRHCLEEIPLRITSPIINKENFLDNSEPVIESEVTHSDQMNIDVLYLTMLGMITGEIKVDQIFSDTLLRRAAALIFGEASIAYYIADSNLKFAYSNLYKNGQHYVDAGKLTYYVLTPESFYSVLANRGIPTVDVHDFVHHAAQFRTWPNFFLPLYNMQHIVQKSLSERDVEQRTELFLLKKLLTFISFATAEYSVVGEKADQSYSYGCLLYQHPRKSPMKKVDLLQGDVSPREFTNWNSLRALMSLVRRDSEASIQFKMKDINWFEELGYKLPNKYSPRLDNFGKVIEEPVAKLNGQHSIDFKGLAFPNCPEELFSNAAKLIAGSLGSNSLKIDGTSKAELESWMQIMN